MFSLEYTASNSQRHSFRMRQYKLSKNNWNGNGTCYKPSTVFVKMLAMLIALCLWEGSSRKSMETWKELDLLFLISVSVVVPCKENANVLND